MKFPPIFTTTYEVATKPVTLSLIYGNKQLGTASVVFNGKELVRGEVKNFPLGSGASLRDKAATIKAIVTDINDKTNLTSIRIELGGGTANAQHDLSLEVDDAGDSVVYRIVVKFV